MFKITFIACCFFILGTTLIQAQHNPEFSKAGFYPIENTGREVFSMNVAWRFHKGTMANAEVSQLDDSRSVVNLPNG